MDKHSYIGNSSPEVIEDLYRKYLSDPTSIEASWSQFFSGFEFAKEKFGEAEVSQIVPEQVDKEFKVINLINGYRNRGHLFTKTNPVRERRQYFPTLEIATFGLTEQDLDTIFQAGNDLGIGPAKLRDIIVHLEQTYCGAVGAEYKYIRSPEIIHWLESRMEKSKNAVQFTIDEKKRMLLKLKFLHLLMKIFFVL